MLNVLAIAMMAVFAVFMAWRAGAAFFETLEYRSIANSPLATPLWIPQSLWLAGLVLFAVAATVSAIWSVILLTRDPEAVNRRFGVIIRHEQHRQGRACRDRSLGDRHWVCRHARAHAGRHPGRGRTVRDRGARRPAVWRTADSAQLLQLDDGVRSKSLSLSPSRSTSCSARSCTAVE